MERHSAHVERIALVARQLAKLETEVVFTGGAIVGLLVTDSAAPDVRPTDDVDVIVGIAKFSDYASLQENVRTLGFKHDMDGPNCRFILRGDPVASHDLEDIIAVIDGRPELGVEIKETDASVSDYICECFARLLDNPAFVDSIAMNLLPDEESQARGKIIIERISAIARSK